MSVFLSSHEFLLHMCMCHMYEQLLKIQYDSIPIQNHEQHKYEYSICFSICLPMQELIIVLSGEYLRECKETPKPPLLGMLRSKVPPFSVTTYS